MKQLFRLSILMLALLLPATATAYDFEVDGIYYNVEGSKATVTYEYKSVVYWGGHVSIYYASDYTGNIVIPEIITYNDTVYTVESIDIGAFYGCDSLTSIVIPNSVTTIGVQAFDGCSGLTSVSIPNSVTEIGSSAFSGCSGLTSILVENGNTNYDSRNNCNAIIETANNTLIAGCQNTVIPNSVTTIGVQAFDGCSGLTSVSIPNSVTEIGSSAFSGCSGLISITIPNTVTTIGSSAFSGCSGLNSILIGNCVTCISDSTFFCCSGLTSVSIPNSVTEIGSSAFSGCIGLYNILIGDSVTCIGDYAFSNCSALTSVEFPSSVTEIGDNAFTSCSALTSVEFPSSVSHIGYRAFSECTRLRDVYCHINDPADVSLGSSAFYLQDTWRYALRTLHVPVGSLTDYQASNWYNYFGSFVEMDEGGKVTAIELDKQAAVVIEGETLQLTAIITPEDATNKKVNWASSNPNVATVDENGLVASCSLGTTTITAMTTDGSNLSASCMVTVKCLSADNCFFLPDTTVFHGESVIIPVRLTNGQDILAFQTNIYLHEGFTMATDGNGEIVITPSNRLTDDHILMANESNGAVSVVCYTPEGRPIGGNSGDDLFYITVQVPEDASGNYAIYLRNSRLTTADYTELRVPDVGAVVTVKSYIPGDANDSRTVTVTDIVVTAQYVLQMNPEPFVFEAADMNGDGDVTVTDIMLIAYFINHPTMNAPQRMPALEGGYDSMSGEDVTLMAGETRKVSIVLNNEMDYTAFQLDLTLPAGLTASNFQLTDRAGNHASDVNTLSNGKTRVLCYSPAIEAIEGHEGALLTFDVTANCEIEGSIIVDGIELVTIDCQTELMNSFTIGVNSATSVNELNGAKTVARVDYFNLAGQQIDRPGSGVTLVVTTYTDGTRSTTKVIK